MTTTSELPELQGQRLPVVRPAKGHEPVSDDRLTVHFGEVEVLHLDLTYHEEMDTKSRVWIHNHLKSLVEDLFQNAYRNAAEGNPVCCPDCKTESQE